MQTEGVELHAEVGSLADRCRRRAREAGVIPGTSTNPSRAANRRRAMATRRAISSHIDVGSPGFFFRGGPDTIPGFAAPAGTWVRLEAVTDLDVADAGAVDSASGAGRGSPLATDSVGTFGARGGDVTEGSSFRSEATGTMVTSPSRIDALSESVLSRIVRAPAATSSSSPAASDPMYRRTTVEEPRRESVRVCQRGLS
jgi:hypothetical protein